MVDLMRLSGCDDHHYGCKGHVLQYLIEELLQFLKPIQTDCLCKHSIVHCMVELLTSKTAEHPA